MKTQEKQIIIFIVVLVLIAIFAWYVGVFDRKDNQIVEVEQPTIIEEPVENTTTTIKVVEPEVEVVIESGSQVYIEPEQEPLTIQSLIPLLLMLLEALQELVESLTEYRDSLIK